MLPSDGGRALEDVAFDLISNTNALAGQIHPIVTESVGNLVRSMNCYYSNLSKVTTRIRVTSTAHCIKTTQPNLA